jgi:hypothetical protein
VNTDTLENVSEDFFVDEDYDFEEEEDNDDDYSSHSGGGASEYQNYERIGDSPSDFAEAMVSHIIKMVYNEDFSSASSKVETDRLEAGRYTIEMSVLWSDPWVSDYKVEGILKVNEDGTDVNFEVTGKNINAEALEFTHETKNTLELEQI